MMSSHIPALSLIHETMTKLYAMYPHKSYRCKVDDIKGSRLQTCTYIAGIEHQYTEMKQQMSYAMQKEGHFHMYGSSV